MRGALGLALLLASSHAAAQASDQDAERLFREGQQLLEQRNFGLACPKFEAAYKIDRQLGTLINLAFCHKEQGSIWYAWLEFREAEVKATELSRHDRKEFVRQRLTELEKDDTLAKVIVDNPQKVPLTDVQVEDRRVPEAERGALFVVEQGRRRFIFKAKGKKPATLLVNVARGARAQHVQLPELEDAPPEPAPVVEKPRPEPEKPPPAQADRAPPSSTQKTIGWIFFGVGAPVLAVGAVTGVMVLAGPCTSGKCNDEPDKKSTWDGIATISTATVAVGAVLTVAGLTLLFTAPSSSPSSPSSSLMIAPKIGAGWAGIDGTF
ncbi:MAG: hypothetical protein JST00_11035 [Deltaproteobacteria bacterium]|nr:hypothetical protein [Deltaproteobacteria bacterium]